jgi:hypothetical protein
VKGERNHELPPLSVDRGSRFGIDRLLERAALLLEPATFSRIATSMLR